MIRVCAPIVINSVRVSKSWGETERIIVEELTA